MRLFRLYRRVDVGGRSGIGLVAEGVRFSNGKVAVSFLPGRADVTTVSVYDSMEDVEALHGHEDRTTIVPVSTEQYAESRPEKSHIGRRRVA